MFPEFRSFGAIGDFNHENFYCAYAGCALSMGVSLPSTTATAYKDTASFSLARQYLSNSSFRNRHVDMVASINGRHFVAF